MPAPRLPRCIQDAWVYAQLGPPPLDTAPTHIHVRYAHMRTKRLATHRTECLASVSDGLAVLLVKVRLLRGDRAVVILGCMGWDVTVTVVRWGVASTVVGCVECTCTVSRRPRGARVSNDQL